MGQERLGPLLHIISVRPSKQPLMVRTFLKVYMELGSYFLFLQEQIKDIIIMLGPKAHFHWARHSGLKFRKPLFFGPSAPGIHFSGRKATSEGGLQGVSSQSFAVSSSPRFAPPRTVLHCAASRRQEERTLRQYTH